MSKKVSAVLIVLFLVVAGLVGYRVMVNKEKSTVANASVGRSAAKVYGMVVRGKPFSDFLTLTGEIEPNEVVNLRSEISGIAEELNFSEGGQVREGQILLRINDGELRAQLAQAKTQNMLFAENERRAKLLLEKEAISQEEYDIASAEYRTAASQIQLIEAQLRRTLIRAPFSGTIGLRNISKGSYITPTTDIAQLVNISKVKLQFSIPEKYATKVKIGSKVRFTVQEISKEFSAQVYAIEPIVEATTRTLRVRAFAANGESQLIPGTFANVTFPLETVEDGLLVPTEALIPIQNGKKLFVLKGGKAVELLVETGGRTDAEVLITKGISDGDTVLTSGVMSLRDGSMVQVTLR
ncbi:efflux RND transporter periplasmic adaptor subunit [Sphingobacterium griseoflavum]|uniref:MexH family multidrug efflux RND transporter periplasmic adaptor subunit n=1 Tax=Sphingobacterium griseoflavum TaxID=1474952 RepID=A0ABQ3I093_9SPHI|nr:efflux RND transporter periplasmic adaptor subunit [Sphingobacterium griseoflavum]GHE49785.1 MexH family multidrug efflux RND transporter periplasmic adaptor subunit [Sphingobacterium griseoflavum]